MRKEPASLAGRVLHLGAAKSAMGHAETAAGAIGMIRAASDHAKMLREPILHLGTLNSYVSSILESASKDCSLQMAIPRQVQFHSSFGDSIGDGFLKACMGSGQSRQDLTALYNTYMTLNI